jgi:spore coat protein U-like protein
VLDSTIDVAGSISVQCTDSEDYDIGLGAGNGAGASITDRKVTGPASATIDYSLFRDSNRLQNWGDITSGDIINGTGDGASQVISVYGRVPAQTTPAAGSYSDTVLVTVSY